MLRSALKRVHLKPIVAPLTALRAGVSNEDRQRSLIASFAAIMGISVTAVALCDENSEQQRPKWPVYRRKEVEVHKSNENGIWVTYEDGKSGLHTK